LPENNQLADASVASISIVSGYFNPLHIGHLRMMEAARELGDRLFVIVNNDKQQLLKKGHIIMPLHDRLEIVQALRLVDEALPAEDEDSTVKQTLTSLRRRFPGERLIFANGGDRSEVKRVAESAVCESLDIDLVLGVGGIEKADSSSRINQALGI
jgi:glycerol-3-phosphate cytidylyltransferase/D-beta-D-heptose 7-phosphate kinase/D-beta-D-heptose 1-phosphate adenosyltransferase